MYYNVYDGRDYVGTVVDAESVREALDEMFDYLVATAPEAQKPYFADVRAQGKESDDVGQQLLMDLGYEVHGHDYRLWDPQDEYDPRVGW